MELVKVTDKTYYIKNPTNIGIYKVDDNNVFIIDSGNDKEAGKKIIKIAEENNWNIKGIINTHSNADHTGGNKVIEERINAKSYAYGIEKCITNYPILEPSFLYGGYPFKDLRNKFLLSTPSEALDIENNLPNGLEYFTLRGHFFDQIGIKTDDEVYFLGDSLFSEEIISKYHLFFIYNVKEYLNTLDYLSTLKGRLFVPSHAEATEDISRLIEVNRNKINEIANKIHSFCEGKSFEDILKLVFDEYSLVMNPNQYVLIGSTVRSYLSYLYDEEKAYFEFVNNKMLWYKK